MEGASEDVGHRGASGVPDTRARRLAGLSMRRLRYWEETSLVAPSMRRQLGPKSTVRLYSFQDLLLLLVVAELRTERDMSLQHIRPLWSTCARAATRRHYRS
jgi:DNA-binding transcriptional MerR regulator